MAEQSMVERVMDALTPHLPEGSGSNARGHAARAAIDAMREPTEAMVQPACDSHKVGVPMGNGQLCSHHEARRRIWNAMIDAALK